MDEHNPFIKCTGGVNGSAITEGSSCMSSTIAKAFEGMPEFMSSQDLVDLGIYASIDSAYQARKKESGPQFIKLKHKILYPKQLVIEFLESREVVPEYQLPPKDIEV